MYHDNTYETAIIVAESVSEILESQQTPHISPTDELWGVYCENCWENWPRYNRTALYFVNNERVIQGVDHTTSIKLAGTTGTPLLTYIKWD